MKGECTPEGVPLRLKMTSHPSIENIIVVYEHFHELQMSSLCNKEHDRQMRGHSFHAHIEIEASKGLKFIICNRSM